jgi:hypothetical protein
MYTNRQLGAKNENQAAGSCRLARYSHVLGREFRGTFSGSATDAHGAAIAKVKATATETRTGAKSDTLSETSGEYTIPFLAPCEYEIAAEAPGFKRVRAASADTQDWRASGSGPSHPVQQPVPGSDQESRFADAQEICVRRAPLPATAIRDL